MHQVLESLEQFVRMAAFHMPLELFVFCGSFLEEVISPIPSALIMGVAGSLAMRRGRWISQSSSLGS
jgi:membrane protein DedA with SNARE-associated domain